jgi:hypothetical protein
MSFFVYINSYVIVKIKRNWIQYLYIIYFQYLKLKYNLILNRKAISKFAFNYFFLRKTSKYLINI